MEKYLIIKIRNTLITKGYSFNTNSDTEVILATFDFFSFDYFNILMVCSPFAIWDT